MIENIYIYIFTADLMSPDGSFYIQKKTKQKNPQKTNEDIQNDIINFYFNYLLFRFCIL